MRLLISFGLILVFSAGAYGQRRWGGGPSRGMGGGSAHVVKVPQQYVAVQVPPYRTYGSSSGFGNVVFPGTGSAPPTFPTTFVERVGASVSGFGYTGVGYGGYGGYGYGGGAYPVPVAYPVVVGGGLYDNSYGYQQPYPYPQQQPNITIVLPPQQTTPPVTINQYGPEGRPGAPSEAPSTESGPRMYQAPSAERPEPADDQVMFFIAMKDSSVYTALAYWVEDGTLHYITPQGRHNQASIDLVDRQTSAKLNEGRKVEFRLPAAR